MDSFNFHLILLNDPLADGNRALKPTKDLPACRGDSYLLPFKRMIKHLEDIDLSVRDGDISKARQDFLKINRSDLERTCFGLYANISWRIGEGEQGLRLLAPLVRQNRHLIYEANDREIAEYANCLTAVGCSQEALALVQKRTDSWALQAKALAHIAQWEYSEAYECLSKVLAKAELPEYSLVVSQVNLVACLVFLEKWDLVREKITELYSSKQDFLSSRLKMNLQGLLLQTHIMTDKLDEADHLISSAVFKNTTAADSLIVEKWQAVLNARRSESNQDSLFNVRSKAEKLKRWEIVRDCDYHITTITKNQTFFYRVYFATPYKSFRDKIAHHFSPSAIIPDQFEYWLHPETRLGDETEQPQFEIDVAEGKLGAVSVKLGFSNHALLKLLCSDLYKPYSIGTLFHGIFPTEQYDPVNSPNRVHQQIKSLRDFFADYQIPLLIEEASGRYRLQAKELISLKLARDISVKPAYQTRLELIQDLLGPEFTKSDVIKHLNCSPKTAQRILADAIERGFCFKFGQSRTTKFIRK